jgi:hypothetical protein
MMNLRRVVPWYAIALLGCQGAPVSPLTDEALNLDDKSDAATELRARVADTTLWLAGTLTCAARDDGAPDVWLLAGRTSRDLVDGYSLPPDHPSGDWRQPTARTFYLSWPVDAAPSLIGGHSQLVGLSFKHSAGRPDALTAQFVVRPRLRNVTGSGGSLSLDVTPVVVAGRIVHRVRGTTPSRLLGLAARAGTVALTDVKQLDDSHFQIDLLPEQVIDLAATGALLRVEVRGTGGTNATEARMALVVSRLGLTTGDAYQVWPAPTCTHAVRDCLTALPAGTLDLASCGEAPQVDACTGQLAANVDCSSLEAAFARASRELDDPAGFAGDAAALIGADRKDAFRRAVEQSIRSRLEAMLDRRFASAAARDTALDGEADAVLDAAYARPLDFVAGSHVPEPGSLERARQIAADALLTKLGALDLAVTELGRPLEVLARQYRSRHVASLRYFREQATPTSASDGTEAFVGNWLDPVVEVTLDPASGRAVDVLFEID